MSSHLHSSKRDSVHRFLSRDDFFSRPLYRVRHFEKSCPSFSRTDLIASKLFLSPMTAFGRLACLDPGCWSYLEEGFNSMLCPV
jgi:hypothetical protein